MPTVRHAIDVAATADDCWAVFTELARWPRWFPFLRAVRGELGPGGRLRLELAAGPTTLPVDVTIEEWQPGARVRWVGGRLGVMGDHSYSFEVHQPGLTRVTSAECFSGLGARLIAGPLLQMIDGGVHQSMKRFKALVEAART
jgi:hypothetical protein